MAGSTDANAERNIDDQSCLIESDGMQQPVNFYIRSRVLPFMLIGLVLVVLDFGFAGKMPANLFLDASGGERDGQEGILTLFDNHSVKSDENPHTFGFNFSRLDSLLIEPVEMCEGCLQRHNAGPRQPGHKLLFGKGEIDIHWFGHNLKKYFVGAQIVNGGDGMILTADPFEKVYLMNRPLVTSPRPEDFAYISLAGNSIKVDVEMGRPGASCGCNVAFFLVSMPGPYGGQWGDYYCDANCVGGNCCAEFDLMEMNVHALQVTSHRCTDYRKPPFQSRSDKCDHSGSPDVKFGNGKLDFGPGSDFTINSQDPFTFEMSFPTEGGRLKGHVKLTQGDRQIGRSMRDLESIRAPLTDGMVLVLDAWQASNLMWLDGSADACHVPEHCNLMSTTFKNIRIDRLPPQPAPSKICPGQANFNCWWADKWGCDNDDGTEGFCRCCCEHLSGPCHWNR